MSTCENAQALNPEGKASSGQAPSERRVLVVDDERLMLSGTEWILRRLDYAAVSCTGPNEALETFGREPDSYDAVVTDYLMPGMSDVQLSQRVLSMPPGLTVLMLTGYTGALDGHRVKQVGIRTVLWKPARPREFRASLCRSTAGGRFQLADSMADAA